MRFYYTCTKASRGLESRLFKSFIVERFILKLVHVKRKCRTRWIREAKGKKKRRERERREVRARM